MSPPSRQALVGIGANLGNRAATLAGATARLREQPGIVHLTASPVFETAPIGVVDQPPFLNAVLGLETTLAPEELLGVLLAIESDFGRVRTLRWGPRTLDLDLLAYEGETRATPTLTLPHPRMLERAFVLVPLAAVLGAPRLAGGHWDALRTAVDRALAMVDARDVREWRTREP